MPMYEGHAVISIRYTVQAEDELQARDFIAEAAQEEFSAEINNIVGIKEIG